MTFGDALLERFRWMWTWINSTKTKQSG